MWDPGVFQFKYSIKERYFLVVVGNCQGLSEDLIVVNVYAPQEHSSKIELWEKLEMVKNSLQGMWVFAGDFNVLLIG